MSSSNTRKLKDDAPVLTNNGIAFVRSPVFLSRQRSIFTKYLSAVLQQTDIHAHSSIPGARPLDHLPVHALLFCCGHGSGATVMLGYLGATKSGSL